MKTATIETEVAPQALRSRVVSDFAELVKARLTLLVLLTTAVGFYLAQNRPLITSRFFTSSLELLRRRRAQPRSTNGGSAGSMH